MIRRKKNAGYEVVRGNAKRMLFAVLLMMSIGFVFVGCSDNNSDSGAQNTQADAGDQVETDAAEPAEQGEVKIIESGYGISKNDYDGSGYVHYGVGVENTSASQLARFYSLKIVGKDESGKIVFSDDQTMGTILPGEVQRFGLQAGNGTIPATVEFSIFVEEDNWQDTDSTAVEYYSISNTNVVLDEYGGADFTGEITQLADTSDVGTMGKPMISVFLKDANGAIIFGGNGYADGVSEGQATAFSVSLYGGIPEYAAYEIYAIPW